MGDGKHPTLKAITDWCDGICKSVMTVGGPVWLVWPIGYLSNGARSAGHAKDTVQHTVAEAVNSAVDPIRDGHLKAKIESCVERGVVVVVNRDDAMDGSDTRGRGEDSSP